MMNTNTHPLVWAKDNAGNRFLCPMDALVDPNAVRDEEKAKCVDDASGLKNPVGDEKLKFSESKSAN